jgi:uncharacterized membrane protein
MKQLLARDEREVGIDRAGDRLGYLVVSYGLLLLVAYRGFVQGQTSWELLALVVLGGLVSAAYRLRHQAMTRQTWMVAGVTIVVALAVGALLGLGIRS